MTNAASRGRKPRLYSAIGLMSGTSADGVDVAMIESDGKKIINVVAEGFYPYTQNLRRKIERANASKKYCYKTARDVTIAHCEAINSVLARDDFVRADLIGFHGQTIYHNPRIFCTAQLGNPFLLAKTMKKKVVSNFREKDIAYGGQGAPLVPIYQYNLLQSKITPNSIIVNIGGISNFAIIGKTESDLIAGDVGPGCVLIDSIAEKNNIDIANFMANVPANEDVLRKVLLDKFFHKSFPKSLTKQYFYKYLRFFDALPTAEAIATAASCTAHAIAGVGKNYRATNWFITGGGRKNKIVMQTLRKIIGPQVKEIETLGINGDTFEAQAFAYLAIRSILGLPLTYPGTTGAPMPLSGGVFYLP